MMTTWFQQLPLYIQIILALIVSDWLCFQCWYAQRVLMNLPDPSARERQ